MRSESPRPPAPRQGLVDDKKQGPPTHRPALPHQESILFFVISKRASPDSLPGVIDAGGVSFSQPLAFDLASPGGAVVAAVSGTPSGAARACADFAARSWARFCKHQEPLPSLTTGNVFCRFTL